MLVELGYWEKEEKGLRNGGMKKLVNLYKMSPTENRWKYEGGIQKNQLYCEAVNKTSKKILNEEQGKKIPESIKEIRMLWRELNCIKKGLDLLGRVDDWARGRE